MNPLVLIPVVVLMVAARFLRPNLAVWMLLWWVATYVGLKFGIVPPLPSSITGMFMGIVSAALLIYATSDAQKLEDIRRSLVGFMVERRYAAALWIVVILLPSLLAVKAYVGAANEAQVPTFGRTIHPAPPQSMTFKGKNIDLIAGVNPYRELETTEPEEFAAHVAEGRRVYYQNCVFCHGDTMEGDGIFVHGLDPLPADFANPTTIAMLQETYLFWRVAKGGPGLPEESGPWSSAMPAWENFLTEEEIWEVILFLYDFTGQKPRAREHVE